MDMIVPIAGSLLAGALIGLEREFRGRPAGFRTHVLVCLASTFLMLAAVRQGEWSVAFLADEVVTTDPTRMAHGLLTGIGFLCAGVIFRDGFSVHGLTTAASLWITSAIGILFGVGMLGLGAAATVLTTVVLAVLRLLDNRLPHMAGADVAIRYRRKDALSEAEVRREFANLGLRLTYLSHRLIQEGETVEHATKVRSAGPVRTDALVQRLKELPQVLEFDVLPHDD
jgi:putative Mg2+ transporter-C (MgtC) family protein